MYYYQIKIPTRKCLEQLAWEICWCLPNVPRQLDSTVNVPIHLGMCTAGSMRQSGIWVCPHLHKAHLQKGCPDLKTSGGNLRSIRIFGVSPKFKKWNIYRFLRSATRSEEGWSLIVVWLLQLPHMFRLGNGITGNLDSSDQDWNECIYSSLDAKFKKCWFDCWQSLLCSAVFQRPTHTGWHGSQCWYSVIFPSVLLTDPFSSVSCKFPKFNKLPCFAVSPCVV